MPAWVAVILGIVIGGAFLLIFVQWANRRDEARAV
jgi:hypothetical protein